MKKYIIVFIILIFILTSCTNTATTKNTLDKSFEEIIKESKNTEVNFYYWGGSNAINKYFNNFISPNLKEKYQITFNPIPVSNINNIVNKVFSEKQAGKKNGSVDIIWINGENFKKMKENNLLLGNLTDKLPNFKKYIKNNPLDFNEKTNGLEVPFGKAQFVFVYDTKRVNKEINTLDDLTKWIKNNPKRFTYPSPPDFTGSAFIRHFYYGENAKKLDGLKEINQYLWREGKTYPNSSGALDKLYSQGEIDFTMSYTPFHEIQKVRADEFPKSSKTLILKDGTLSNTHFLTIPYNSKNISGSLVAINYLISFEAQLEKMKPDVWGDLMVLKNEYLNVDQKEKVNSLINKYNLNLKKFENSRLDEFSGDKIEEIEKDWQEKILE